MSNDTETILREALEFDPMTPSLSAGPIIRTARRRDRRRQWGGAVLAVGVIAGAGLGVDRWWSAGTEEQVQVAQEQDPSVLPPGTTLDIGQGWWMTATTDALCLGPGPGVSPGTHEGCGVNVRFHPDSTFSWADYDSPEPVQVWVVRNGTASASIVTDDGADLPGTLYQVEGLDLRIAVVHDPPPDASAWRWVSRDDAGTVTDDVLRPETVPIQRDAESG